MDEQFEKRLLDLANQSRMKNIVIFSDFLNLNELHIFHSNFQKFSFVKWKISGGYEFAERQIVAFIPDAFCLYEEEKEISFPITVLEIKPCSLRFAESLTHRDYLGAVLNLGIDRSKIGDILTEEGRALLFCKPSVKDIICRELCRVRHTTVSIRETVEEQIEIPIRKEKIQGSVSSVRLDAVISQAFPGSRSSMTAFIESGKVFVNGKMILSNGYHLKENDIISVRGMGRFQYMGEISKTKKGRILISLEKYS
ncbi:MAG: YlmH/Sll1252 family protein [Eubacteriales bacterium]|nr:YlmH/Sll1252 family protein [Eubacteriales bacterium]